MAAVSLSPCLGCGKPTAGVRCGGAGCGPADRRERQRLHGRDRRKWRNGTRRRVLVRDGWLCRYKHSGCTGHATTVHRLPEFGPYHDDNEAAYRSACDHCHGVEDGPRAR